MPESRSRSRSRPRDGSVATAVAEARACIDDFPPRPQDAQAILEAALKKHPDSPELLEALGVLLCEEGDEERALPMLQRSLELEPTAEKHLALAQLFEGLESLQHYEKAIEMLKDPGQLARACAAVAELFMTDLCDEEDAEQRCEAVIERGLKAEQDLQLLATKCVLRRVQGQVDEAREVALACLQRIKANSEEATDETLISLAETMIECAEATESPATEARELLQMALERDEEDVQVWYLLGCSHMTDGEFSDALDCAEHGLNNSRNSADPEQWTEKFQELEKDAKAKLEKQQKADAA